MTIKKNIQVVPEKQYIAFVATADGAELRASLPEYEQAPLRVHDGLSGTMVVELYPNELDALIELLHAVKSERSEAKRLVEAVQPHEEIIAVTEPTA